MHPTLVFDIETIPDLTGFAAVNGIDISTLPHAELTEMALLARRQKTGSDFMPHHLHRVVAISCALRSSDALKVWSLGEPGSSEADLIQQFYDSIEHHTPQLVSWNGGGFDLPVLHYRALIHGVTAPRYWDWGDDDKDFKWNSYLGRYHTRHLDLMDVLAMYQPRANAPLDQMAKLCGFPGKLGMDGSQVLGAFQRGEINAIHHYCETDAMNTWLVYLRFQKMRGTLSESAYAAEIELTRATLTQHSAPHWQAFLAAWA
ncbi:MAG TPA: 3'-5' exonuclease [Thiobacillus sp.]|nr:MAG: 3'-5' exonuclease [Hydrogenophilales bacterium 28-61-11]OYZ57897.1 MAG: 3'-5' exonuclease [Hydrogenophilales bacterium 16-61-112]HQT69181.1 3'-5' exonuclease [Thiobacillus sp.]